MKSGLNRTQQIYGLLFLLFIIMSLTNCNHYYAQQYAQKCDKIFITEDTIELSCPITEKKPVERRYK